MNILLWVLQVLLALHTAVGAVWKLSNSEQAVPALSAIPHGVWLALIPLELLCALGLILPAIRSSLARIASAAAVFIAAEMLFFCGVYLFSSGGNPGELVYWLIVALISAFVAYGRAVIRMA